MRWSLPFALVSCIFAIGPSLAGVAPNGPELQVNTYTTDAQYSPAVAVNAAGNFVVIWSSYSQDGSQAGVFARRFDSGGLPAGGEFQANTFTTGYQGARSIAMNAAGGFVVSWTGAMQDGSAYGVLGRIFDSAGSPAGGEFLVNSYTTGSQYYPAVAMSGAGDFVVVWESNAQDGDSWGIFGRMFDSGGGPVGSEFQVNTYTTSFQTEPAVAMSVAGEFVVTWESYAQDGYSWGVFGQLFDSAGSPAGGEFQVNTYATFIQASPAVAMSGTGDFVVAWQGQIQDGSSDGIFGQRFDSGGSPVGAEFQVNTHTTSFQYRPVVVMGGTGDFVVAWVSGGQDGSSTGVFGRTFESGGSPVGGEFQANSHTTGPQKSPDVALGATGDLVVAWQSYAQDGSDEGIFAQRVVTNGPALNSPAQGSSVDCSDPALSRPTFTWDTGDYDKFKVFMGSSRGFEKGTSVSSGDQKIVTGSWSPSKKKWKSACNKAITQAADPNNAIMYIAVEGQDTGLAKSDPLRKLLSFPVRTSVQP